MCKELLDFETLDNAFYYDGERLRWKIQPRLGCIRHAGDVAGCVKSGGYRVVGYKGKSFYAHRLIWKLVYGSAPKDQIDHIDGNRDNNKIDNLRDVSHKENQRNRRIAKDNKPGYTGVYFSRRKKNYYARITTLEGKRKCLGYFDDFDDAVKARKAAEIKYGFHENHGKLAVTEDK